MEHLKTDPDNAREPAALTFNTRRRLIGGAAGGVGVFMAVQARTALGATLCQSPSAMVSGNTSPGHNKPLTCSGGRSPGFWKVPQKFPYWAGAGAVHPQFNKTAMECLSGMKNLSMANVTNPGTPLTTALGGTAPANVGIWEALAFPSAATGGQLARHLAAAWLNAGKFPDYPITRQQIQEMWMATSGGGTYCPSSILSCGTNSMDASEIIAYISGIYDFNAVVEPMLCVPD